MSIIDLRNSDSLEAKPLLECDLCIVGSGPAGATLAAELSGSGLAVTLLESGRDQRTSEADALDAIENVGARRHADQWSVRNRILGGSSHTWGGRCAPFDEIDFEARSWVPYSGWPIAFASLAPYMARSASHLGLTVGDGYSDARFWPLAGREPPAGDPDPDLLLPFFWQFSRDPQEAYPYEYMRFGRGLERRLAGNVTIATGATVVAIEPEPSGRAVREVVFADPAGRVRRLRAPSVALCAGGVENTRILLASNTVKRNGLGNDHDQVGRYLMDHLRGTLGLIDNDGAGRLKKRFGRYNIGRNFFRAGLRLSPKVQRQEQLLNCAAWLGEALSPDDPWSALRRIAGGAAQWPKDAVTVASNAGLLLGGALDYFVRRNGVPRKLDALELVCMCEQLPDADSRITLSERRDRNGVPLPKIDWRIHDEEARTLIRTAELVAAEFARLDLPRVALAPWVGEGAQLPPEFVDVAHPSGTTRMSEDPTTGVVDQNCQVHGIDGLYVMGSSVFPTVGHCNPTQTIVALAVRLADHLKTKAVVRWPRERRAPAPEPALRRVLVTGATGRIGKVLVADLLARGHKVRAVTSQGPPPAGQAGLEWRRFDMLQATEADYDGLLEGCDGVAHLAAELGKKDRMWPLNAQATRLLAQAAERAALPAFCYVSTVAVYGSGRRKRMDEDAPVLTLERDIPSEYWALDYVRAYGRSKLAGERAIAELAHRTPFVVLRPAVVVDIPQLIEIRQWGRFKRTLAAHRHAHHVYVGDVADAIGWSLERCWAGKLRSGAVETYNLSEDEYAEPRHAQFMRKAYQVSGDARFKVTAAPWIGDWMHDFLRFRTLPLRRPLWAMRFPNDRLLAAGWSFRFGMAYAEARALEALARTASVKASPRDQATPESTPAASVLAPGTQLASS